MLTREYVKLPDKQQFPAPGTSLIAIHSHETRFKVFDILLDLVGAVGRVLHVLSKMVYPDAVRLESAADFILDRVQGSKRREIWQDVFDLEQGRLFEQLDGTVLEVSKQTWSIAYDQPFDVVLLFYHVFGNLEPQLTPQFIVVLWFICIDLGKFQIALFQRQVNAAFVEPHFRINVNARLDAIALLAYP